MKYSKVLILFLSFFLLSCSLENRNIRSNMYNSKSYNNNMVTYAFSAQVISSAIKNRGRGAARNKLPARVLKARVIEVYQGKGIRRGQIVKIKMKDAGDGCKKGKICTFRSPYKHPAVKRYIYILEATTGF